MATRFKMDGFPALQRKLARLGRTFDEKKSAQTAREAGEIVLAEMERLVPVRTGALRDSLGIFDDGVSVLVGPRAEGAGLRAQFTEFGTVHSPAQPFSRPAFDNTREEVKAKIGSTIASEVQKAVKD